MLTAQETPGACSALSRPRPQVTPQTEELSAFRGEHMQIPGQRGRLPPVHSEPPTSVLQTRLRRNREDAPGVWPARAWPEGLPVGPSPLPCLWLRVPCPFLSHFIVLFTVLFFKHKVASSSLKWPFKEERFPWDRVVRAEGAHHVQAHANLRFPGSRPGGSARAYLRNQGQSGKVTFPKNPAQPEN